MDVRNPNIRRIEVRPDVVHIHTSVYNIVTHKIRRYRRQDIVEILGEDILLRPAPDPDPDPVPQPETTFALAGGTNFTAADFDFLFSAPFFIFKGTDVSASVGDGIRAVLDTANATQTTTVGDGIRVEFSDAETDLDIEVDPI